MMPPSCLTSTNLPKFLIFSPTKATVPVADTITGAPGVEEILTPSLCTPRAEGPNSVMISPSTGQLNTPCPNCGATNFFRGTAVFVRAGATVAVLVPSGAPSGTPLSRTLKSRLIGSCSRWPTVSSNGAFKLFSWAS